MSGWEEALVRDILLFISFCLFGWFWLFMILLIWLVSFYLFFNVNGLYWLFIVSFIWWFYVCFCVFLCSYGADKFYNANFVVCMESVDGVGIVPVIFVIFAM